MKYSKYKKKELPNTSNSKSLISNPILHSTNDILNKTKHILRTTKNFTVNLFNKTKKITHHILENFYKKI